MRLWVCTRIMRNKTWRIIIIVSLLLPLAWFTLVPPTDISNFDLIKQNHESIVKSSELAEPAALSLEIEGTSLPTPENARRKIEEAKNDTAAKLLFNAFNKLGAESHKVTVTDLIDALDDNRIREYFNAANFVKSMTEVYNSINAKLEKKKASLNFEGSKDKSSDVVKVRINLAAIACGKRTDELETMLKSAALFSQDAILHVIVFTDKTAMISVARVLLELKWTVMSMGWELTFEMHEESFPGGKNSKWKGMYKNCATQRLFFPSLLNHLDSVIYLDTDIIVVSNLTELWMEFGRKMKDEKMVAMAQNSEPNNSEGYYDSNTGIPFILPCGANAGVMLMNLTRMREFKFEERAIAINLAFKEMIILADQDIVNILFSVFTHKAVTLDCSFNFYWAHCGDDIYPCHDNVTHHNKCFCNAVLKNGVQIIHGNTGSFFEPVYKELSFFPQAYKMFEKLDLLTDSFLEVFRMLKVNFESLEYAPCAPLTVDQLYRNAFKYLKALSTKSE